MRNMSKSKPILDPSHPLHIFRVHRILAHSYSVYFLFFLIGVVLNIVFNWKIFSDGWPTMVGATMLAFATLLILWAQHTSRNLNRGNISKETFCRGPYCYTRSPTHWGLFLLMLGFGLVVNSFFVVLFTALAFLLTRLIFLAKEEQALVEKYGEPYREYQKTVKL